MSISSRITEMEQHIGNAYDKIEDLGIDLTDVDKNINNISSMLEEVWNEYPKVSVTDVEEASIDGTKKGRMKLDLKGNTEQDTLTGKNFFDINNISNTDVITIANDTITLANNTNPVGYTPTNKLLKDVCPLLAVGDNVYISFKTTSNSTSKNTIYLNGANITWSSGTAKTITQEMLDSYFTLYGGHDETAVISEFMIRKSTEDDTYEPYCGGIPSPNPDYPQTIHNVIGSNEFKIQNKNLLNIADGNTLTTKFFDITDFVEVGKTYSFSAYLDLKNTTSTAQARLRIDKYIGTEVSYLGGTLVANKSKGISKRENVTLESSVTKVVLTIQSYGVADFNCDYSQIMGEQGTTATSYVPHKEQNLPFSLRSKNLLNINRQLGEPSNTDFANNTKRFFNYDTYVKGITGANNYSSSSVKDVVIEDNNVSFTAVAGYYGLGFPIKVKPNTNYCFSVTETLSTSVVRIMFYDKDGTYLSNVNKGSFITPSNCDFILVFLTGSQANTTYNFSNIQIEEGTTATDYEPYYDYELSKIGEAKDYFFKEDGKWYLHKEIGKTIWNTKSKYPVDYQNIIYYVMDKPIDAIDYGGITSSSKKPYIFESAKYSSNSTGWDNSNFIGKIFNNAHYTLLFIGFEKETTLEQVKELLDGKNLYYQFKMPKDIEITETTLINQLEAIKKAQSCDDQTNISQKNEDLPFILNIEALKK